MDLQTVKTLIEFVGRSRISKLVVTEDGITVRISNGRYTQALADAAPEPKNPRTAEASVEDSDGLRSEMPGQKVLAPVFGVLHRSPNPDSPVFVEVGDVVGVGQNLCIVEAMKVFNTVSAHKAGAITRIFASDGQEVEAGQPLMEIG